jgi:pimeloyl-ACP methyl ester carboxylesterase
VADDRTLELPSGRTVGFADYGAPDGTAVLWCHGGPGSRLEPRHLGAAAAAAGLRIVAIDRPGYGLSTPQPGRTIAGWVPEALAVLDRLSVERAVTVGHSTGGAYALAVAALAPDHVLGAVPCAAVTDMADPADPCRNTLSRPHALDVWDAPDRAGALAAAAASHGVDGSGLRAIVDVLAPSDLAKFADPERLAEMTDELAEGFTFGVEGYADDRIADGRGWVGFDVASIRCPVVVLHGMADPICDPCHARRTAALVPDARLRLRDGQGHFSILDDVVPTVVDLLSGVT